MGWQDLLQAEDETIVLPWAGGKILHSKDRVWGLKGPLPREHGWHTFKLSGRNASWVSLADPAPERLGEKAKGYLVGDHLILDGVRVDPDPDKFILCSVPVNLVEPGIDRFVRIVAGKLGGRFFYESLDMPQGPEDEVRQAFQARAESVAGIKGVSPALDMAFRLETWRRAETARQRAEAEQRRREEAERRAREEQRRQLAERLGNAEGRRQMAQVDFGEAARAALAVGGAEYLDSRPAYGRNEMVVQFLFQRRQFECVCDKTTLRIIDSGICLVDHRTGEKGDTYFTLESFPGVIREAMNLGKLVVFRHVGEDYEGDDYDD